MEVYELDGSMEVSLRCTVCKMLKGQASVMFVQDVSKAKQFLPFLQRAGKTEALVEFVAGGSRLRLYIPKETCLITLLLSGDYDMVCCSSYINSDKNEYFCKNAFVFKCSYLM